MWKDQNIGDNWTFFFVSLPESLWVSCKKHRVKFYFIAFFFSLTSELSPFTFSDMTESFQLGHAVYLDFTVYIILYLLCFFSIRAVFFAFSLYLFVVRIYILYFLVVTFYIYIYMYIYPPTYMYFFSVLFLNRYVLFALLALNYILWLPFIT